MPRNLRRRSFLLGSILATTTLAVSCGADATGPHHWDYEADGPGRWADLDRDYLACGSGRAQSPIDLPGHERIGPESGAAIDYGQTVPVTLVDNGHTVQADLPPGSSNGIELDGARYDLKQFHFHVPSEHTVDGVPAAMEMHFVHRSAQGSIAVLAVLMQPGAGRSPFAPIFDTLPGTSGEEIPGVGPIDPGAFLPARHDQFRYYGSLTTPPCTEGVSWAVLGTPVGVTRRQVAAYSELFDHTNRPTQPRNGREVVHAHG